MFPATVRGPVRTVSSPSSATCCVWRGEWGYIDRVPKIRLAKDPEGRLRFLTEDEIERLLTAYEVKGRKSAFLLPIVILALQTGMRKA